ncbi:ribosome maturation factor RimP [Epidermidibacterium keratini]|uniref:Ribosome maturation factor RimP n=1 Tax=Epidermidibacterium keratini TaxID=1891644 RepID=A0A7L4YTG5_9ACTN|nr:ribosome maturation factor RimP [Epidermidibacterium keratini]
MTGAAARRQAELTSLLEPVVADSGFDLEGLHVSQAGRRSLVRVVVDSDNGVSLDDIAVLSKSISAQLDEGDDGFGSSPYTLEVTSPGVDRPLTTPRHWRRARGRLVRFERDGKPVQGRVLDTTEKQVRLDVDGEVAMHDIESVSPAKVQVEFSKSEPKE